MTEANKTAAMVHYECGTCGMTATCYANGPAVTAWFDHMTTHVLPDFYRVWTWEVLELPL